MLALQDRGRARGHAPFALAERELAEREVWHTRWRGAAHSGGGAPGVLWAGANRSDRMTITLHCLDCGFRFSLTLATGATPDDVAGSLSCGQCRCRRWAAA